MKFDVFSLRQFHDVTLCGTNVYARPEFHPDRTMDEHDLLYVYSGEWTLVQDEIAYTIGAGDVLLLRAGSHHYAPSPCAPNSMNMFIHFSRTLEDRYNVELSAAEAASYALGDTVCIPTLIHCGTQGAVESLFREIIDVYWSRRDDRNRKLNMLMSLLLAELSYFARKEPAGKEQQLWFAGLLQTMRAEMGRFFTLEEAAEMTDMQVRTFSSRFRKVTGRTFQQYQMETKLQMAYDSLSTGPYTVKQVAEMYGFCDPYYFSRVFKKTYGMSPKEVKQNDPSANINRPWMN